MALISNGLAVASALPISQANVTGLTTALAAKAPVTGTPVVRGPFSFTFATAGLNNGVTVYTPTTNDVLLDAWIEVTTAFNGTTPLADIGTFVGTASGLFRSSPALGTGLDLTAADVAAGGTGLLQGTSTDFLNIPLIGGHAADRGRWAPMRFTATNPLLLVVSQDALKGGAAIGGAAGAGSVYIVTATPVALP